MNERPDPDPSLSDLDLDPVELERELDRGDPALQTSLRALLAPPTDIEGRVTDQVSEQLIGGSVAGTAFDLLGLGVRTLRTILTEGTSAADRSAQDPRGDDRTDDDGRGPT